MKIMDEYEYLDQAVDRSGGGRLGLHDGSGRGHGHEKGAVHRDRSRERESPRERVEERHQRSISEAHVRRTEQRSGDSRSVFNDEKYSRSSQRNSRQTSVAVDPAEKVSRTDTLSLRRQMSGFVAPTSSRS